MKKIIQFLRMLTLLLAMVVTSNNVTAQTSDTTVTVASNKNLTVPNLYSEYTVVFEASWSSGTYDFAIDTNTVLYFSGNQNVSIPTPWKDTITLSANDLITLKISNNVSTNGSYKMKVTYIGIGAQSSDTTVTVASNKNLTVPNLYSEYTVVFESTHNNGGYDFSIDTNNVLFKSGNRSSIPFKDTITLSANDLITLKISNHVSSNGSYKMKVTYIGIGTSTGLYSNKVNKIDFNVFPNPTNDYLTIDTNIGEEYRIIDLNGKVVRNGNVNGKIDLRDLKSGIYIINVMGISKKIIKE